VLKEELYTVDELSALGCLMASFTEDFGGLTADLFTSGFFSTSILRFFMVSSSCSTRSPSCSAASQFTTHLSAASGFHRSLVSVFFTLAFATLIFLLQFLLLLYDSSFLFLGFTLHCLLSASLHFSQSSGFLV
jgi:hypothetical protein